MNRQRKIILKNEESCLIHYRTTAKNFAIENDAREGDATSTIYSFFRLKQGCHSLETTKIKVLTFLIFYLCIEFMLIIQEFVNDEESLIEAMKAFDKFTNLTNLDVKLPEPNFESKRKNTLRHGTHRINVLIQ